MQVQVLPGDSQGMTAVEGIYVEPLGCCLLVERSGDWIKRIFFSWDPPDRSSELVEQIADHLLNGRPCQADQELTGLTAFQREVFQVVSAIPRGKTLTYGEVAKLMGKPGAARAVGRALGANPFAILVPCHRAVSRSDLGAYFLGKDLKKRLLDIESLAETAARGELRM